MGEQSLKNQVRKLIAVNKTDEALDLLSKAQLSTVDRELIILTSQYNQVREELRLDVIGRDEAQRRINKVNLALIDLSDKIEAGSDTSGGLSASLDTASGFNRNYLWLLLLPLLVIVGYMVYTNNQNTKEPLKTTDTEQVDNQHTLEGNGGGGAVTTQETSPSPTTEIKSGPPASPILTLADIRKDPAVQAYYPFNGDAVDEAGHKDGRTNGGVKPTADRNGVAGQALSFDGAKGSVVDARMLLDLFSKHFSVAFWLNPRQYKGMLFGQVTTEKGGCKHCAALCNHCLYFTKEGAIGYDEYPPNGGSEEIDKEPQNRIPIGKWTHVVFERDETKAEVRLYLNGELVAKDFETETFSTQDGSPKRTWIGGRHRFNLLERDFFEGSLDELYVFNRPITEAEIQLLASDKR